MQTLVVAEKPSVARDIARVLGAKDKGENCLIGGGYAVTWALGHLVTLKEPQELDERYTRWRAEDLPILPEKMETKVIKKTKSQFLAVKKLMNDKETQDIICATDSGREGELIFRYIYEQAGCKKPVRRLWISSMTDEAIRAGFDSLRPSADYDALYASARLYHSLRRSAFHRPRADPDAEHDRQAPKGNRCVCTQAVLHCSGGFWRLSGRLRR